MPTASADARRSPSPAVAAALWMTASAVFGTAVAGFYRLAAEDIHPLAIPFFRVLFALPLVLPWLLPQEQKGSAGGFAPRAGILLHLGRAVAVIGTIVFFILAMEWMSIADATALVLAGPVFAVAFGALLFGERAGVRGWVAVALGLGGALIVIGPAGGITMFGAAFGLLSAVAAAADWLLLKRIAQLDGMGRATAWLTVLMLPLALPLVLFVWTSPTMTTLLALAGAALGGTLAQALAVRAFALGRMWHLTALSYLNVPFAAALGWLFFAEDVEPWTLIGGAAVVAAAVVLAQVQATKEQA